MPNLFLEVKRFFFDTSRFSLYIIYLIKAYDGGVGGFSFANKNIGRLPIVTRIF